MGQLRWKSFVVGMSLAALVACTAGPASDGEASAPSSAPTTSGTAGTVLAGSTSVPEPPTEAAGPGVIIDTDLSLWWDDISALGIANVLVQRGELRVLGIGSNVPNARAVAAIDAVNTAYGNDDLALGAMAGSASDTFAHGYTDALVDRLPHSVEHSDDVPDAVALYRQLLAAEPDRSVTIVAIGSYTNLAGLLESPPDEASELDGRALIAAKVERTIIMDGLFPDGGPPLTNQEIDPDAARAVVTGDWPSPISWFDAFGGVLTFVGGTLCTDTASEHPMRIAYEHLFACAPPGDGNWDAPALLYAVGDRPDAFEELGRGGAAVLTDAGGLAWAPSAARADDVYVRVRDQPSVNARIDELLVAG